LYQNIFTKIGLELQLGKLESAYKYEENHLSRSDGEVIILLKIYLFNIFYSALYFKVLCKMSKEKYIEDLKEIKDIMHRSTWKQIYFTRNTKFRRYRDSDGVHCISVD
jgi:hypothetical protein